MSTIPVQIQVTIDKKMIRHVQIQAAPMFTCTFVERDDRVEELVNRWISTYLSGKNPSHDLPLDFSTFPPFAQEVLQKMQHIPFGECVTYQELAQLAGSPRAARAVGTACRNNPFPFFVPCHRVIRSDGTLGGYNCGLQIKESLLDFESRFF